MTVERINAYRRVWEIQPPVHNLVAGFLSYERPKLANFEEFAAALGMQVPDG